MPTSEKDFKVKNGLQVSNDVVVGGNVISADPSADNHVATKSYVDQLTQNIDFSLPVGSAAPSSPSNGDLWFNTEIKRLSVYYAGEWITLSAFEDAANVSNHTHLSPEQGGFVLDTFIDGGDSDGPQYQASDAGAAETSDWPENYNAGFTSS